MKKINAWLKKFFRIGMGEDVRIFKVENSKVIGIPPLYATGYKFRVNANALKDGSSVMVDHNKKTVTFKMI
jgi:hypothetical protein